MKNRSGAVVAETQPKFRVVRCKGQRAFLNESVAFRPARGSVLRGNVRAF